MTNNPTIDGVSRPVPVELLERLARPIRKATDESDRIDARKELRALLDADIPASVAPAVERQDTEAWPSLEAPAMVGCTRFSKGVSSRLVVEAAQRYHSYEVTPDKEAQRMMRVAEFSAAVNPPEVAALQSTIAQLQARIAELESGRGEPVAEVEHGPFDDVGAPQWVRVVTLGDYDLEHIPDGTKLYTAPPVPVAVVLPGPANAYTGSHDAQRGWDSYAEELIRLNPWMATAALNGVPK